MILHLRQDTIKTLSNGYEVKYVMELSKTFLNPIYFVKVIAS